jgi:hypothetical protein
MCLFLRLEDKQKSCVKLSDIIKSSLLSKRAKGGAPTSPQ